MTNYKLHIYNSHSGKKEQFVPIHSNFVGLYVCGPTVYNYVHLGNCRTFISFDTVYRYLLHIGYKVRYVRNITDVGHLENDADEGEDKIAKKARLEQVEPMEIVQKYTLDFHDVLRQFNNHAPSIEPTATGHIIEQNDKNCSQNCHKPSQVMFHTRFQDPWAWAGRSASWTEWPGAAAR